MDKTSEELLLKKLFTQANMTDLPAMSAHVQELISLTSSSEATAADLTAVVMKDYSLSNKILQVANSAYYSRGIPINSIARAVTVIGFTVVRQLALAIALFEELLKASSLKTHLSKLMTKSTLSATLAQLCDFYHQNTNFVNFFTMDKAHTAL